MVGHLKNVSPTIANTMLGVDLVIKIIQPTQFWGIKIIHVYYLVCHINYMMVYIIN